ncbi:alginate export family protein [Vulcaniibacterium gelatinicum]|uniref:alginate export family protein n=1 Tax=Vulcaniibacterium gelatinicum TaxID=2598725 RepID=UPI0015F2DE8A|nr:alginate export family protein [Vulcaniibacterium gelatinicum]
MALLLPGMAAAQSATPAPKPGLSLDLRLRYELVDDDAFARDAEAGTLRARIGWRSPVRSGWSFLAEAEGTVAFDDSYNSTRNGKTAYPQVADPENAEINQLLVNYQPGERTRVTFGRQRLAYDNQRFIGNIGWRQNEQTFDALDVQHRFGGGPTLRYSYLDRVQRVFGNDHPNRSLARWDLDAHLLSLSGQVGPGTLTGYAHLIENRTLPLTSHRNLGLRYTAKGSLAQGMGWLATAEYARQDDYADAPARNDADYFLLEGGLTRKGYTAKLGFERLGGDGTTAFQTPLATLHAFNGWADKFLTTPPNGLDDLYLSVGGPLATQGRAAKAQWLLAFHDYGADRGGADYGSEWNAQLSFPIADGLSSLIKYADYRSDVFARDTTKLWLQLEWKH